MFRDRYYDFPPFKQLLEKNNAPKHNASNPLSLTRLPMITINRQAPIVTAIIT